MKIDIHSEYQTPAEKKEREKKIVGKKQDPIGMQRGWRGGGGVSGRGTRVGGGDQSHGGGGEEAVLAPLSHLIPRDNVRTFAPPSFREGRG